MKKIFFLFIIMSSSLFVYAQPPAHDTSAPAEERSEREHRWERDREGGREKRGREGGHHGDRQWEKRMQRDFRGHSHTMWIPIGAFIMAVLIAGIVSYFRYLTKKSLHQVIIKSIEHNQPLPKELVLPGSDPRSDFKTGIILVFTGLALAGFFLVKGHGPWAAGFFPLFIGMALLLISFVEKSREKKRSKEKASDEKSF